jgi:hypothetical protein
LAIGIGHVLYSSRYEIDEPLPERPYTIGLVGIATHILPPHFCSRGCGGGGGSGGAGSGFRGGGHGLRDRSWSSSIAKAPGGNPVGSTAHLLFCRIAVTRCIALFRLLDTVFAVECLTAETFTVVSIASADSGSIGEKDVLGTCEWESKTTTCVSTSFIGHRGPASWYLTIDLIGKDSNILGEVAIAP